MDAALNLPKPLEQKIVTGIMIGYKDYLAIRKEAQNRLAVSTAYAWVKGNHIDSSVQKMVANEDNITVAHGMAGYAWEYLQFAYNAADVKSLIIIKNQRSTDKSFNGVPQPADTNNYLYQFAGINNPIVNRGKLPGRPTNKTIQLELTMPELSAIQQHSPLKQPAGFSRFYIVTYELDNFKKIKSVMLNMPKQQEMSLYPIMDLTPLIQSSDVDITDDELGVIQNDRIPDSIYSPANQSFGYEVAENEESKKQQE